MTFDTVIINGIVVTAGDTGCYSIGIKDGKITALAPSFTDTEMQNAEIIDAEGGYVMPGGIDSHVHVCQDINTGLDETVESAQCADDFETGSRSGVAGGNTTFIAFAMQDKGTKSLIKVLEDYDKRAEATGSYMDYGYHMIICRCDKDILENELPELVGRGISSIKLFTTYAALQLKDDELLHVMSEAKKNQITTMVHAENGDIIRWLTEKLEERGMTDPYFHTQSRLPIAEGEATSRVIVLAEMVQNPVLFVHVSAASAMETIRAAQTRDLPIYGETCPQYQFLSWEKMKSFNSPTCFEASKLICSPPPGPDGSDQDALWTGLRNGTFTVYSSDHCPFRYSDKRGKMLGILDHAETMHGHDKKEVLKGDLVEFSKGKMGHFGYVPNGCPGIETRLPLLYTNGLLEGRISPERFVQLTSTNAAKLYGMYPQKGALMPGLSDADLTIWYPDDGSFEEFELKNERLHHNVDYTPYEGMRLRNWPRYTILRGKVMWKEGKLVGKVRDGKFLKRGPSLFGRKPVPSHKLDPRRVPVWMHE